MAKIDISNELAKKIIAFCDDELNYHINESGCADEYQDEIEAQIELLRLLGKKDLADKYAQQFKEEMGGGDDSDDLNFIVTFWTDDDDEIDEILEKMADADIDYDLDMEPDSIFTNQAGINFLNKLNVGFEYDTAE